MVRITVSFLATIVLLSMPAGALARPGGATDGTSNTLLLSEQVLQPAAAGDALSAGDGQTADGTGNTVDSDEKITIHGGSTE